MQIGFYRTFCDGSCQRRLPMVHVTNRPDVDVWLGSVECLLFRVLSVGEGCGVLRENESEVEVMYMITCTLPYSLAHSPAIILIGAFGACLMVEKKKRLENCTEHYILCLPSILLQVISILDKQVNRCSNEDIFLIRRLLLTFRQQTSRCHI